MFFFKNNFFEKSNSRSAVGKIHSRILSGCQTVWIQIRPNVMSGLIMFQTVRKSYQQTTLVDKDFIMDCNKIYTFKTFKWYINKGIWILKVKWDKTFHYSSFWFDTLRPINNLSVIKRRVFLGWTSTKLGIMCLAQGHNAVTPVRLKPVAPRSRVKHSTTEPLRSLHYSSTLIHWFFWGC